MFTIIGGDGREYGPVSVEQVRLWLAAGRANLATQAKRIGEDAWRPLGEFAEFSVSASHEPPPLEEPEVMTGPIDAKAYANALIARAAPLDPFDCFDRSWRLLKGNFWPLFGITLLVLFLSWLVSWLAGHLPRPRFYFGEIQIFGPENLANFLLGGVFTGGLYYYYLKKLRGRPTQISDAFHGFTAAFLPLAMLIGLFTEAGLPSPSVVPFQVRYDRDTLIAQSFPADDDRERLRTMIDDLIATDAMDVGSAPGGRTFTYPTAVLTAIKN